MTSREALNYMIQVEKDLGDLQEHAVDLLHVPGEEGFETWLVRGRNLATLMEELLPINARIREVRRVYADEFDAASLNRLEQHIDRVIALLPEFLHVILRGVERDRE